MVRKGQTKKRAVGYVRVSRVGGRGGDSFLSDALGTGYFTIAVVQLPAS